MKNLLLTLALLLTTSAAQAQIQFDLNKDNSVNVGDVTTLVNVILGKYKPDAAVEAGICPDENHPHIVDMGAAGKWACCNVGATAPWEYGGRYAWGETEEKQYSSESSYQYFKDGTYEYIGDDISGKNQYDVAAAKWGGNWQMPTKELMEKLVNCGTSEQVTLNGIQGELFTSPAGARLFLPAAGFISDIGLGDEGHCGTYWSSTISKSDNKCAYFIYFYCG